MGGPDSLEAVQPFLRNIFSDRDIIQLPGGALLQRPFARLIARLRAPEVSENYARIGGASPIGATTAAQASGLAAELEARGHPMPVAVAMRYWHPFTDEALTELAAAGVGRLVVLSLYPHFSWATSGSSLNELMRVHARRGLDLRMTVVDRWYDHPGYLDALARRVRETVTGLGLRLEDPAVRSTVLVLWSAHGLPKRFIDRGDPYVRHVDATLRGVVQRLADLGLEHRLGYQSRTGPVQWIGPGTEEVLAGAYADGYRHVVFVPVSFVSDHIETLYEIEMLFGDEARALGYQTVARVPAFDAAPDFVALLADLVMERLGA
jgi:ferrochelatase